MEAWYVVSKLPAETLQIVMEIGHQNYKLNIKSVRQLQKRFYVYWLFL